MNLICITESELSQWVSRRNFDTLFARVIENRSAVTTEVFSTAPFIKLDDARGRIIVNLKDNWKKLITKIDTAPDLDVITIPIDAVLEIAPALDQYAKRLVSYNLPIANWSVELIWDSWLINQAVKEIYRAIKDETDRVGFIDREFIENSDLVGAIIRKSLRPKIGLPNESILSGWTYVLENRDSWLQELRKEGHLDNKSLLLASIKLILNDPELNGFDTSRLNMNEEGGWNLSDINTELIQLLSRRDVDWSKNIDSIKPPFFCIVTYLRLYDEINHGAKDWRTVFNLLRFTKYAISSLHADILTVALLSSLKAESIYMLGLRKLYMS
jgi:hypothetical protein